MEFFEEKSKKMAKETGVGWGYYSYFSGIILGAQIHLERKHSYDKYLKNNPIELSSPVLDSIKEGVAKFDDLSHQLYEHLEIILKTKNVSIETNLTNKFIESVDNLNSIYHSVTGVEY